MLYFTRQQRHPFKSTQLGIVGDNTADFVYHVELYYFISFSVSGIFFIYIDMYITLEAFLGYNQIRICKSSIT